MGMFQREIHHINNREAPRKVLITPREETNRGVAGAFLTIIDTTYARQFPPTHQQDDGACFNFFPRALTETKQQQLREVCADKQCKTKTGDLPPPPPPSKWHVEHLPFMYDYLPFPQRPHRALQLKAATAKKKKRKEKSWLGILEKKRKEELLFNPIAKPYFDFRNTVI